MNGVTRRWLLAGVVCALCGVPAVAAAGFAARSDASRPLEADGLQPVIEVWKADRRMELRSGEEVVREFRIVLGTEPRLSKNRRGDGRTPVGHYYISDKNDNSRFRRFLGISYPNLDDAERAYGERLIDAGQWADIFFANLRHGIPPWQTPLGGRVGIHGFGGRPLVPIDWTEGCIAVSDDDIDFLYDRVGVGTPVIINQ